MPSRESGKLAPRVTSLAGEASLHLGGKHLRLEFPLGVLLLHWATVGRLHRQEGLAEVAAQYRRRCS